MEFKNKKTKALHMKNRSKMPLYKKLGIAAAIMIAAIIILTGQKEYVVKGLSMEPTLSEGDCLHFSKYAAPEYGALVVFTVEGTDYGMIVKRVIGLEGDVISVNSDGTVVRNGENLTEDYIELDMLGNSAMEEIIVEPGMIFVLGDNRAVSIDSRDTRIGQIPISAVCGTVTSSERIYE